MRAWKKNIETPPCAREKVACPSASAERNFCVGAAGRVQRRTFEKRRGAYLEKKCLVRVVHVRLDMPPVK